MTSTAPSFRPLTRAELDTLIEWAATEGWNPGGGDAAAFAAADPDGFWGIDVAGELVGAGSTVTYSPEYGFFGLFIMRPEWRGQGIGAQGFTFFIDELHRRIPTGGFGLDGVFVMQPYYAKHGFVFSHRNIRMGGTARADETRDRRGLVELADLDFADVVAFDAEHFGVARPGFLRHWINPSGGRGVAVVADGSIAAMGVVRPVRDGYKLAPLFARTPELAEQVFAELAAHVSGSAIYLDVPEITAAAVELAQRHELVEGFGCARMYVGTPPPMPWSQIYGVTSFELG